MLFAFILALISFVLVVRATRAQEALEDRVRRLERMLEAERQRPLASPPPTPDAKPTPPPPPEPVAVRPAPPAASSTPPAARPMAPAPPPPPTLPAIDWEQWLGVRGAAVLGGIALALAGIFFFRYSIEHDLIPPWLRVVMATLVGLGALAASERDGMRPDLVRTADALAGAGVAVLYAAFWASGPHYQLVPGAVAFVLMTAVTAACGLLSLRHSSLVIALLGLVGGFATPLLLASGADRPIGLFGYLLLLDAGVITLAKKRGWPFLAALGLCATLLYQLGWITTRMGADRLPLGIGILVLFMLVFSLSARNEDRRAREEWAGVGVPSALIPFAFALYFAARADLAPHFTSVAVLLVLLESAVLWLAASDEQPPMEIGAAAAAVVVMGVWLLGPAGGAVDAWRANLIAVAIALPFQIATELRPHDFRPMRTGDAAVAAMGGLFLLLLLGGATTRTGAAPWPWLVGWLALAGLLLRQSALSGRGFLCEPIGIALGMAMAGFAATHAAMRGYPEPPTAAALLLGLGLVGQATALHRRGTALQTPTERGAALLALLLLQPLAQPMAAGGLPPIAFMGASTGLGLLALLSATRGPCPWLSVAAVASTALVQTAWTWAHAHEPAAQVMIGAEVAAVVLFASWPLLVGARAGRPVALARGGARPAPVVPRAAPACRRDRRRPVDRGAPDRPCSHDPARRFACESDARRGPDPTHRARLARRGGPGPRHHRRATPAREAVDHHRVGARSGRGDRALAPPRSSGTQMDGAGAAHCGLAAPRGQPRPP